MIRPPADSGISESLYFHALPIERSLPRAAWAAAIEKVPAEHRDEVKAYLRDRWHVQVAWERMNAQAVAPAAESRDTPRGRKPRA